jgi:acetate kinase
LREVVELHPREAMKVLVINSGSSSIKYKVFDVRDSATLASGKLEKIGESSSRLTCRWQNSEGKREETQQMRHVRDHKEGFSWIVASIVEQGAVRDEGEIFAIGHRVVHGGEVFHEPTLVDKKLLETIRSLIPLAPLHNPANLVAIEIALERFPHVPQVAVFDTAFHQSLPSYAYHYALPYEFYIDHHVRRYGFHGTSHHYVAQQAAKYLKKPVSSLNLITLHLGNGASATAIKEGKSIDTSMGMTPLEGLIMGTRSGDLDPAIIFYINRITGKSNEQLEDILNEQSGLKGICGVNDMREVENLARSGDARAQLAIDMFCYRIRKYIGAYLAILGDVDALVFTGGIGENSVFIRKESCHGLSHLGIVIDGRKNKRSPGGIFEIQGDRSAVKVLVIPTNEELEIARQTVHIIKRNS